MTVIFMATIILISWWRPDLTGANIREPDSPMAEKIGGGSSTCWRRWAVFVVVMGSIYTGWATATEKRGAGRRCPRWWWRRCTASSP
jgi:TRAP-type C4-dicarboxylate transport system permease large subunit